MSRSNTSSVLTRRQARAFAERARWRHAWSVPSRFHPHEYTVRAWHQEAGTEDAFEAMVRTIRSRGYEARFGRRTFLYWEPGDGFKYWSMGAPIHETTVLNRSDLERDRERAKRRAAKRAGQMRIEGTER